jgi:predicted site-specific integrase-resolvase
MSPLRPPKSAAQALGVSVKTLNGFVRDGEIRYIDVGRGKKEIRRMFTDEDLEEFKQRRARREVPCQSTSTKTARSTTTISNSKVIGFMARRALRANERQKGSSG